MTKTEKEIHDPVENRKYKRLKSIFPIEYTVVHLQGDLLGLDWQKGCTSNVSQGGLCLETTDLNNSSIKYLSQHNIYLDLRIHIPFNSTPVKVVAEVAWYQKDESDDTKYLIGLKFHSIAKDNLRKIMFHAQGIDWTHKILIWAAALFLLTLMAILSYSLFHA